MSEVQLTHGTHGYMFQDLWRISFLPILCVVPVCRSLRDWDRPWELKFMNWISSLGSWQPINNWLLRSFLCDPRLGPSPFLERKKQEFQKQGRSSKNWYRSTINSKVIGGFNEWEYGRHADRRIAVVPKDAGGFTRMPVAVLKEDKAGRDRQDR